MRLLHRPLKAIDENTPHRFRFELGDGAQEAAVATALGRLVAKELTYEVDTSSRPTVIEITSSFTPKSRTKAR